MTLRILSLFSGLLLSFAGLAQDSLAVSKLSSLSYTTSVNDVWGYAANGREFALVGVNTGFSIVEVTDPANPVELQFIPGANSIWRDIKTWSHYAYVVHDSYGGGTSSDGIMIVDLNTVDSNSAQVTNFYPTIVSLGITFTYDRAHNLYIDENGVMYVFGSNAGTGGALMFDLTNDPEAPVFLGEVTNSYYHDGVARGDTLWGAAIYKGQFEVVDVSTKSSPVVMATQSTPYTFTHNIWFSDDNKTVFTTDEKTGAPVAAYDVSDLNNISLLDTIRTGIFDPSQVIPHNTHVYGDFLVTSYYTSGVQIVDASQPDILVETAYYDTSPLTGNGYEGAWGAYPYLPSGHLLVSDRQEGLFVLQTSYPRASFLTLLVKDSVSGNPIVNAQVNMLNATMMGRTNIFGNFREGQRDTGYFDLVVSKPGYQTDTISLHMEAGKVLSTSVCLLPNGFSLADYGQQFMKVYPNPLGQAEGLTVYYPEMAFQHAQLQIVSGDGRLVYELAGELQQGENRLQPNLGPGIYTLLLRDNGDIVSSQKLVVVD